MLIGIVSDTHDKVDRTRDTVRLLRHEGIEVLIHCGDITGPEIVHVCAELPFYFVFGNNDSDSVADLQQAAEETAATCLGWGGEVVLGSKRIAVVHGHLQADVRRLLGDNPDYLLSGHSHIPLDICQDSTRRINPGAIHRSKRYPAAVLDTAGDQVEFIEVPR